MKELVRAALVRMMRRLLLAQSRPYPFPSGATLVIAPHADDETLGCGELIAAHIERGLSVAVLFVSDSGAAHPEYGGSARAGITARRRAEALAALTVLGVSPASVHFLEAPDGQLDRLAPSILETTRSRLTSLLSRVRPARLFVPVLEDGSSEHEATYWLAHEATAVTATPLWEYAVWAWWNPLRLRRQLTNPLENFFFTSERTRAQKIAALERHVSQLHPPGNPPLPPALQSACCGPAEFYFLRPRP